MVASGRLLHDRSESLLGETQLLADERVILHEQFGRVDRLLQLGQSFIARDLTAIDQCREMSLALVDTEFFRKDVPLIEPGPDALVMFPTVITPSQLALNHRLRFGLVIGNDVENLDHLDAGARDPPFLPARQERVTAEPAISKSLVDCRLRSRSEETRLNSSHLVISYAVFCLKKKKHKQSYSIKKSECKRL